MSNITPVQPLPDTHISKQLCMSLYLALRFIPDEQLNFYPGLQHRHYPPPPPSALLAVTTIADIENALQAQLQAFVVPGRTALLLSGGMDSALIASYLPAGTKAYTFHCLADGAIDETGRAAEYARRAGLDHEIIDIRWADFERLTPRLLRHDGVPFHSIEVQLLRACEVARAQGMERLICGDSADVIFGGLDGLLSREWSFAQWAERYTFTPPAAVLHEPADISHIFAPYRMADNLVDYQRFIAEVYGTESTTSYMHAFACGGMAWLAPYVRMTLTLPLDLARIRSGESKYLLRELFKKRYPELAVPAKIPMPRAMAQWLAGFEPTRDEFLPGCTQELSGDQKWQVYCLERFLDLHEPR